MGEADAARHRIMVEGRAIPLDVRVNARARTIAIRIPPDGSPVRLTLPSPRHLANGLAFAQSRGPWIAARLAGRSDSARALAPGASVPVAGTSVRLETGSGRIAVRDGDVVRVGGDGALYAGRIKRWLVTEALGVLTAETHAVAARGGLCVAGIRVGDPRSRWGSCTTDGRICYSWRLILAPDFVRRSVVAHEVAHLAQANHGPHFWALADRLLGSSHTPARAWLRQHGGALHGWGRAPAIV